MKSITKLILDRALKPYISGIRSGNVLDVGAKFAPYRTVAPQIDYKTLDIDPKFKPDIISDIHDIKCAADSFDTVIATEVLEHCHDPQKAVDELRRILKPHGACILSTRFFYPYHPDPGDYYRFTSDSLNHLFRNFTKVEVASHGNRFHIFWEILPGRFFFFKDLFNFFVVKINFHDPKLPLGFIVYAEK